MFLLNYLHLSKKKLSYVIRSQLFLALPCFILFYMAASSGCSNNNVTGTSTGNSVTFTISQQTSVQGIQFLAKPSVDVKVTKFRCILTSNGVDDTTVNQNPNYVFSKDTSYILSSYTGVTTGQKWNFNFIGSLASAGTAYNVTSNYTVP